MIQSGDIIELIGVETVEAAALKTLIHHRFFERLLDRDRLNILRDWRVETAVNRPVLLDRHATLNEFCESFISVGEILRNQGDNHG